jgi:ABC-2 type transport system ATP-binding protein
VTGRPPTVRELDALDATACAAALAPLFEGAPRFLARLCASRPFGEPAGLFATARAVARAMPEPEQLELIDAHPRLGAAPGSVSALSFVEQGYDREAVATAADGSAADRSAADGRAADRSAADPEDARVAAELERLNAAYEARFGFRYCVFVAGRPRAALLPEFAVALGADRDAEIARALKAVVDIAEDRYRRATAPGARSPSGTSRADPVIVTHDLAKRYGSTVALARLNLTVERGEVFGFLGPNGAGKTTAVKLLVGLTAPTSGTGTLLGAPLGDREARRRLGYLPELFRYQPWLTGREVLRLHCELARLDRSTWDGEVEEALVTVGLDGRGDDRVATYSKGMQQRLGLGVALLGQPDLVLLDEPTSALDPQGRQDVRRIIAGLRERGVSVFLNSHLLGEVERVCDRVAIVDRGRVIASQPASELVGARSVRIQVRGLGQADRAALARFGRMAQDGEWLAFADVDPKRVPDIVAAIVGAGGRVAAVLPGRESLEERFFELLAEGRP